MNFTVNAKDLKKALKSLSLVFTNTSFMRKKHNQDYVKVTVRRYDIFLEVKEDAKYASYLLLANDVQETGGFYVSFSDLYSYVNNVDGVIKVVLEEEAVIVSSEKSLCKLSNKEPADLEPTLGVYHSVVKLTSSDVFTLKQVLYAVSKDTTKPVLTTVCVDFKERTVTSTDGYRLASYKLHEKSECNSSLPILKQRFNLPLGLAKAITTLDVDTNLALIVTKDNLRFTYAGFTLIYPVVDSDYPQTEFLIPETFDCSVSVLYSSLKKALKPFKNQDILLVELGKDFLTIEDENSVITENVSLERAGKSGLKLAIYAKFLKEALKNIPNETKSVSINANPYIRPFTVVPSDTENELIHLIMPRRHGKI